MADVATLETAASNGHIEWLDPADEQQLRACILQADDRPEELVEVPLWRVKVLIRAMTGTQRALYEANPRDSQTGRFKDLRHAYFHVVQMCCVHPNTKKPIFTATDEIAVMNEKNGAIIDQLAAIAVRLSMVFPSQAEQIAKNSEATPTSTTISGSQSGSATNE